jgi:hypothetical protein
MPRTAEVEVLSPAQDDLLPAILGQAELRFEDPGEVANAIALSIATKTSAEDIFGLESTVSSKDLVGVPLEVRDWRLMRSDLSEEPSAFMVIDAVNLETGEVVVMTSGSKHIMAQLYAAKNAGLLPRRLTVQELRAAKPGQSAPLSLVDLTQVGPA